VIPRWLLAKLGATLGAWLVAFLTVMALLTLFGDELKSLPLALRALVISGVLVVLMANLVMPIVNRVVTRWLPEQRRSARPNGAPHLIARGDP